MQVQIQIKTIWKPESFAKWTFWRLVCIFQKMDKNVQFLNSFGKNGDFYHWKTRHSSPVLDCHSKIWTLSSQNLLLTKMPLFEYECHTKTEHFTTWHTFSIWKPDLSGFQIATVQWGSKIWPFKNRKHSKTRHFEGQFSNGKKFGFRMSCFWMV